MLSQIVDTLIFITVAFYGVFPIGELILGQMIAKVVLSAVLVPPLVYGFVAIGRALDSAAVRIVARRRLTYRRNADFASELRRATEPEACSKATV